jgi:hypothetical protein
MATLISGGFKMLGDKPNMGEHSEVVRLDTFAPPVVAAEEVLGTPFHQEMLRIAYPNRAGSDRGVRSKRLDRFHWMKIRYIVRQKHFFSRLANYLTYRREAMRADVVHYLPPGIQLETGKNCLLGCPGCVVGLPNSKEGVHFRNAFTSKETMESIFEKAYKRAFQVSLYLHGEPLLNKHFFDVCRYAGSKGLWTVIHTNLMPNTPDLAPRLIESRLCNLVASIDGATQETYERYRRGGDLDTVFTRIRELSELRRKQKLSLPWITAKFHVFEHNWHEIKGFRERALKEGADEAVYVSGFANGIYVTGRVGTEFEFNLSTLKWEPRRNPTKCPSLWSDMPFDSSGAIVSCGYGNTAEGVFSEYTPASPAELVQRYNSPKHVRMRRFFLNAACERDADLPTLCRGCEIVRGFSATCANSSRVPQET